MATTIGGYLISRLRELGVEHVFGVAGDYNLDLTDEILAAGVGWVGTCNELNAAYAADGYARMRGAGALVTTCGVGELSAVNGVAGSYAESVPVVHVSGAPASAARRPGQPLHHTFGDDDFGRSLRVHAQLTVASAELTADDAPAEIDRVLRECWIRKRPVHLTVPADLPGLPAEPPDRPLIDPFPAGVASDPEALSAFAAHAAAVLAAAGTVSLLAGHGADRHGARAAVAALLAAAPIPAATLVMGKDVVDETCPGFLGQYLGAAGPAAVRWAVEEADCLIGIGLLFSDVTSAGFTHRIDPARMIELAEDGARVGSERYAGVRMVDGVRALTALVAGRPWPAAPSRHAPAGGDGLPDAGTDAGPIGQAALWERIERFLRPGDVLVADTGTTYLGTATIRLPADARVINQPLWGSTGHSLPAALGSQFAVPERRHLVLAGDGGFQMTAAELGTFLRHGLAPIVVVVNNDGYAVERRLRPESAPYADIAPWSYAALPGVMGDPDRSLGCTARTLGELDRALRRAEEVRDRLVLIEVHTGRADTPPLLDDMLRVIGGA